MARTHRYLIALGSNQRHIRHGRPQQILSAALDHLTAAGVEVAAHSPIIRSDPVGPSQRRYANSVALITSDLPPDVLLHLLQETELTFGRIRRGQRWRARVLDLDIILWSGGNWAAPNLTIPHPSLHQRSFVLGPAARISGGWRDPITNLSLNHLYARLTRPRAAPR